MTAHQFKDGKCTECNIREGQCVNDPAELLECKPDWDYEEYCIGDPTTQYHQFAERIGGVMCSRCNRFIGNWET